MVNVVKLVPGHRPKTFTAGEEFIDELRERIFKSGLSYKEIASHAHPPVSAGTIQRLVSGKTGWPRPYTLFAVCAALGVKIGLID